MRKYIAIWIMMVLMAWGCDDFLTVKPKSDIKETNLFETAEGCEEAIYGVYSRLGESDTYGRMMRYYLPEMLAQSYIVSVSNNTINQIRDYQHDGAEAREEYGSAWSSMYEAIGYVNNVITNLENVGTGSFKYYDCYLGEMLGLRAFLHFDLLRLFAPNYTSKPDARAIPYVTKWVPKVTPFSTVKEAYGHVISDLKEAERLLEASEKIETATTDDFVTKYRNLHFNLDAAHAMLARVYWMRGDLDSAGFYAEKVISTEKYHFVEKTEVQNMQASIVTAKEAIWGINQLDPLDQLITNFYQANSAFMPRVDYSGFYSNETQNVDMRLNWFRVKKNSQEIGDLKTYFLKFFNEDHYFSPLESTYKGTVGFNLIRISEMYLIAAEALLTTDQVKAMGYYDLVATSRNGASLAELGKAELTREDIDKERYREFFGEGYEWYNMKRENRDLTIHSSSKVVPGTDELYTLTIPNDEFDYRYDGEE